MAGAESQVGGRLLGQGVYGCTFEPAPRCAGGRVFRDIGGRPAVGKVTVEDIGDELAAGRRVMALPMASAYFALPTVGCRPEMPLADPDASRCRVLTEATEEKRRSMEMLVLPAAGQQIVQWGAADPARMAANFVRIFVHLLEGMVLYQDAGYVHNDIHEGNILVDERGVARYIDFGLAFRPAGVRTWEDANLGRTFRPKYIWQAPEVHAWRMALGGVSVRHGVAQLAAVNEEYGRLEAQYPARPSALASLHAFMSRDRYVAAGDFGGFARAYGPLFDSWRIGLCMWFQWNDLLRFGGIRETALWQRYRERVRAVIGGLTEFDPRRRWSARRALAVLDPGNRMAAAPAPTAPVRA
ncbi:hypothetical protein EBZ80_18650 [bacterium]|nr:hypothetical protein [bacterium]